MKWPCSVATPWHVSTSGSWFLCRRRWCIQCLLLVLRLCTLPFKVFLGSFHVFKKCFSKITNIPFGLFIRWALSDVVVQLPLCVLDVFHVLCTYNIQSNPPKQNDTSSIKNLIGVRIRAIGLIRIAIVQYVLSIKVYSSTLERLWHKDCPLFLSGLFLLKHFKFSLNSRISKWLAMFLCTCNVNMGDRILVDQMTGMQTRPQLTHNETWFSMLKQPT